MAELEARIWGIVGAAFAGAFAVWLLFFPDRVGDFAWVIQPRLAQVFIGAGYIFRTAFFLNVAIWPRWERFRWIFWGNLAFTGTLLLATFWHADRIRWGTVIGHAWLILYVAEPTVMIYLSIGRSFRSAPSPSAVPMRRGFVRFLMLQAGLLGMFAALLILNPDFAGKRWPWPLNPMDARIVAAWFFGWAVWAGTMAFASDWREVRAAAFLNALNGVALLSASLISIGEFNSPRAQGYLITLGVMTVAMVWLIWRQENAPTPVAEAVPVPQPG
jgi:hypothetical protein